MLILTRRIGESVIVGDDISATIIGIQGEQIRIAVSAPEDIPVHREEIYLQIQNEQRDKIKKIDEI